MTIDITTATRELAADDPLDLAAITACVDRARAKMNAGEWMVNAEFDYIRDVQALVAEVERLRAIVDAASAWRKALAERRHFDALRALDVLYGMLGGGSVITVSR